MVRGTKIHLCETVSGRFSKSGIKSLNKRLCYIQKEGIKVFNCDMNGHYSSSRVDRKHKPEQVDNRETNTVMNTNWKNKMIRKNVWMDK